MMLAIATIATYVVVPQAAGLVAFRSGRRSSLWRVLLCPPLVAIVSFVVGVSLLLLAQMYGDEETQRMCGAQGAMIMIVLVYGAFLHLLLGIVLQSYARDWADRSNRLTADPLS